ncbi:MAG: hypothetical protein ACJ79J_11825, partial [Gemmatimonadaceae bacterium]
MNGVIVQRILGLAIATLAFSSLSGGPAAADAQGSMKVRIKNIGVDHFRSDEGRHRGLPIDVT